jgi:hypothetical protein
MSRLLRCMSHSRRCVLFTGVVLCLCVVYFYSSFFESKDFLLFKKGHVPLEELYVVMCVLCDEGGARARHQTAIHAHLTKHIHTYEGLEPTDIHLFIYLFINHTSKATPNIQPRTTTKEVSIVNICMTVCMCVCVVCGCLLPR